MIGFGFPWLLLGAFVALPALYTIYKLRQRTRRRLVVSSLFLWQHVQETRAGGQRLQRFKASWLFWLELLVLCLLLLAAAAPTLSLKRNRGALMIVLDDSFSMRAGGASSARASAEKALRKVLKQGDYSFARLLLAGQQTQLLGGPLQGLAEAGPLLSKWRCMAPKSSLLQAVSLAWQLGGKRARLLVLTDHPPAHKIPPTRVRWWAWGKASPNVALTYASRVRLDQKDWALLEVAYFGKGTKAVVLTTQEGRATRNKRTLQLKSGVPQRIRFALKGTKQTLVASVAADALALDDRVSLLPLAQRAVRVQVDLPKGDARKLLMRTLQATKDVELVSRGAVLRWTQAPRLIAPSPATWGVHWHDSGADIAYKGPFVLHQTHPVSRGLSLRGVIWGAGQGKLPLAAGLSGLPLLTAGDIPLLSVQRRADGGRALHLRWRPAISTLAHTPNWPIFVWNVVHWRQSQMPGVAAQNLRLGSDAIVRTAPLVEAVKVTPPTGKPFSIMALDDQVKIPAQHVGRYQLQAGKARYQFVVNALHAAESDLRRQQSGRWGKWPPRSVRKRAHVQVAWVLLLLVLLLLSAHSWLSTRLGETP